MPTDPTLDEQIAAVRVEVQDAELNRDPERAAILRAAIATLEATRPAQFDINVPTLGDTRIETLRAQHATWPAPLPDGEPSPEALEAATPFFMLDRNRRQLARALDAFALSKVEEERARCLALVKFYGNRMSLLENIHSGAQP
jgi:hypothetical protein